MTSTIVRDTNVGDYKRDTTVYKVHIFLHIRLCKPVDKFVPLSCPRRSKFKVLNMSCKITHPLVCVTWLIVVNGLLWFQRITRV